MYVSEYKHISSATNCSFVREYAAVLANGGLVWAPSFPLKWLQQHVPDPIAQLQLLEMWHQVSWSIKS